MKEDLLRFALLAAVLPVVASGCVVPPATAVGGASPMAEVAPPGDSTTAPVAKPRQQLAPPSATESRYGIQITQIGLTAAGGLVDFRFKVLDAAKARQLLGDPANAPVLIAEHNPPLMPPHHALRGAKFGEGARLLHPVPQRAQRHQARRRGHGGVGRSAPGADDGAVNGMRKRRTGRPRRPQAWIAQSETERLVRGHQQ